MTIPGSVFLKSLGIAGSFPPPRADKAQAMKALRIFTGLAVALSFFAGAVGMALAVDCGEPVPAPKFQIGDTWVFQDDEGAERTETVVGFDEGLTLMEWVRVERKTVLFLDRDLIVRKVIEPDGTVMDGPGQTKWIVIGQRTLEFPLHTGKTWSFSYSWDLKPFWSIQRVVGCEKIVTVAGEFAAMKIEVTRRRADGRWQGVIHQWYAPATKRVVRWVFQRPNFREDILDREVLRYRVK